MLCYLLLHENAVKVEISRPVVAFRVIPDLLLTAQRGQHIR